MVCVRTESKSLFDQYPIHLPQAFIYIRITFDSTPNEPDMANDPRKLAINTRGHCRPYSKHSMPDLDPIGYPTTNSQTDTFLSPIVENRYIDDTIGKEEHHAAHRTTG